MMKKKLSSVILLVAAALTKSKAVPQSLLRGGDDDGGDLLPGHAINTTYLEAARIAGGERSEKGEYPYFGKIKKNKANPQELTLDGEKKNSPPIQSI